MLKKYVKKILRCSSGATVVEYALVAPILLLLILGALEYNLIMYASAVLDGATSAAARLASTGYDDTGSTGTCHASGQTRSQFITCIVGTRVGTLMNTSHLTIASKSYAAFNDIAQPEPYTDVNHLGHYVQGDPYTDVNGNGQWDADMGAAGLGNAGDIVVYTVSYPWPIFTPLVQQFFGNNGTLTISASSVVKNEPYGTSSSR